MLTSKYLIKKLKLIPHPEGGHYARFYESNGKLNSKALPESYKGARPFSTAIYYMLQKEEVSRLHKLKSDEIWHSLYGESVIIYVIEKGRFKKIKLGTNFKKGDMPCAVIPKNSPFAAELQNKKSFALVSCTVSPGFDFNDFTLLPKNNKLIKKYPLLKKFI